MKEKETSFKSSKIGSLIYKTILNSITKTCNIEKLTIIDIIKIHKKCCHTEKELILNNGDHVKVCATSYRHWEFDDDNNLVILYTTNKITALYNIQYHLMLHNYNLMNGK